MIAFAFFDFNFMVRYSMQSNHVIGIGTTLCNLLRHTKASIQVFIGRPLTELSQNMCHASKSTTLDYYTHFLPQDRRKTADQFENLLL